MLEIKNLTKIYKTSRKEKCIAVNDITLDLPSKGMIFVTGKSGSGKSTLLNMIGTLDNITSGDIVVDGISFKKFKEKQFQQYRSSYLGFIFQDFLLLEEFTVKENIALALKLSGSEDEEYLNEIIKRVDLVGKEDKFPNELSGGQRQRVAIARSLVKKPKMLLCDEPTGNLDYKTSKQILDLLKEESKTKLVIVVSHNGEDAENYADRIIELMDGKIVKDHTKNPEYSNNLVINENFVILPHHKDLTKKEVATLNEKLKTDKFKVAQNKGGFFPTKTVEKEIGEFKLQSAELGLKNSYKLSSMFLRKNKHGAPYTILITALFISLFYIFQVFVSFKPNISIDKIRNKEAVSVVNLSEQTLMGSLSSSRTLTIDQNKINEFYSNGYSGNIYKLYNYNHSIRTRVMSSDSYTRITAIMEYASIGETYGTLCCDEEYLKKLFSDSLTEDGNLKLTAGSLDDCERNLIMTDYIADILIEHENKYSDHESIVKKSKKTRAIIDTGYKEKYANIYKKVDEAVNNKVSSSDFLLQNSKNEEMINFLKDVETRLALTYSFSDDFHADIFSNYTPDELKIADLYCSDGEINSTLDSQWTFKRNSTLKDDEIYMSYSTYNSIFGTFYSSINDSSFKPIEVTIRKYYNNDPNGIVEFEKTVKVTKLTNSTAVSKNLYRELLEVKYHCYGLYFDNVEQYDIVRDVSTEQNLLISSIDTPVIPVINTILGLFMGLCYFVLILLFVVSFAHIVLYGIGSIRKNLYEIGVLKALGAKSFDIGKIFIVQIAIIGFLVSIVSILGIYLSALFSDILLISAFEEFLTITIYGLNIIPVIIPIVSLDLTLVFIISIISSIIPLIYLKTIKPLNILKGKKK